MDKLSKKVTIREVAAKAGVSISSVSRYLSDPKSVQPLAAYNIKNAISELKFSPNSYAQSLKKGSTKTIGIVIPHVECFFGKACAVISDYFYERDYVTFICESDNSGEKERFFVQELLRQRVAGIIIVPCGQNTAYLENVARNFKNMVIFGRGENIGCDVITADHEANSYRLTRFLLERNAGDETLLLMGPEEASSTRLSEQGIRRAFLDAGRGVPKHMVYNCRNLEILTAAVRDLYQNIRIGTKPIIIAMGEDFLENAAVVLNRFGREALKRVDLAGLAMPDALDKLGVSLPCIIKDPKSAGIVTAEVLYRRIMNASKKEAPEPVRYYELKVEYTFIENSATKAQSANTGIERISQI